ncbi:MAG: tetratricopeptide repeat protein [Acidobacteriia bacterium]|nr:tetratricopeptide repeat protein [Terriglobia bacterium]
MARYTRHQLKEDKFAEAVQDQVFWAVAHRNPLTIAGMVAAVLVLAGVAGFFYLQNRDEKASIALGAALRIYDAQLRPANAPAQPNVLTFTSAAERARAAQKEFRKVAQDYPHTRSAEFARYWVGVTAMDMADYQTAETELKGLTGSRRDELAPLAKFALASVYRSEGKDASAIQLYKELIDRPGTTVPKSTAQIELAGMYESTQPAEAARIYDQIHKDSPNSVAGQIASARAQVVKPQ